jgi:hypothetical protein
MPEHEDTSARIRELKDLGFLTSIQGAGIDETRTEQLYRSYREQDDKRAVVMDAAYGAIVGREE